jgi:hypothetical protein
MSPYTTPRAVNVRANSRCELAAWDLVGIVDAVAVAPDRLTLDGAVTKHRG